MKTLFLCIFFLPFVVYPQDKTDSLTYHAIAETLPLYLNTNPNSIASFLKENNGYRKTVNHLESISGISLFSDSIHQFEIKKQIEEMNAISDSIKTILLSKKIQVKIKNGLSTYSYKPEKYEDLRKSEDWKNQYENLKEDFVENKWVRLDTTISMEFADLIKKQIDLSKGKVFLDIKKIEHAYYQFINIRQKCKEQDLCIQAYKLYQPVFNKEENKACYLYSYKCRSGICRDFIFIEILNGKWTYIASYPSHLIGHEK